MLAGICPKFCHRIGSCSTVTGVPSGSRNESEVCCFICGTSVTQVLIAIVLVLPSFPYTSAPKEGEALQSPVL